MRRAMCCVLAMAMFFSLMCPFTVSAAEAVSSSKTVQITSVDGETLTYSIRTTSNQIVVECYMNNGILVERSVVSGGVVTQEIKDSEIDGSTYTISECIYPIDNAYVSDFSESVPTTYSNLWYEPPLMNDAGLTNSPIFSGYKYLGTTAPDSIYNVSVSVHRRLDRQADGQAYKFNVSAGTTVSTLAGILISAVLGGGLLEAAALGLATAFVGSGIDTFTTGTVKYVQYHYTYKYNCNDSTTYTYKCCECRQWWCIYDAQGNLKGYEQKDMMANNHVTVSILQKCSMVIQDYLNGEQVNAACANAPS